MREMKDIEADYRRYKENIAAVKEEWKQTGTNEYKNTHNFSGHKTVHSWIVLCLALVFAFSLLIAIPYIPGLTAGPELVNDHEYSCPSGDWSGITRQMVQHADGYGGINLYCPEDGRLIGHMLKGWTAV